MYTNIVILLCKVYIVQLPLINLAYIPNHSEKYVK